MRAVAWFEMIVGGAMAVLLVTAGAALLRRARSARLQSAVALGALAYTAVASPGYYAASGDWAIVGMFAVILAATAAAGGRLVRGGITAESRR